VAEAGLQLGDVGSLQALFALGDFEIDPLAFIEATETIADNRGVMDEDVRTVVTGNEPVSLFGVEPLHGSLRHRFPPFNVLSREVVPLFGTGETFSPFDKIPERISSGPRSTCASSQEVDRDHISEVSGLQA
jgi:hypothetical protein